MVTLTDDRFARSYSGISEPCFLLIGSSRSQTKTFLLRKGSPAAIEDGRFGGKSGPLDRI